MTSEDEKVQPTLPGLEFDEALGSHSRLRQAVATTIKALVDEGLIEARHAGMAQLALEMADAVDAGIRTRKASAAAMAAAQLRETLQALPEPIAPDLAQKFAELVEELANGERA